MNSFGLQDEEEKKPVSKSLFIYYYVAFFHISIICDMLGFVKTLGNRNVWPPLEDSVPIRCIWINH